MTRKIDALTRPEDADPTATPTKKKLLRNVTNALLNKTAPIAKAGLLGVFIDALPHVLASRKKIPSSPKLEDLRTLFAAFNENILTGNLFKRIFSEYPTKNSWGSTLLFSCLVYQLSAPSKVEYPPRPPSETDDDILARHGVTTTQSGMHIVASQFNKKSPTNKELTRIEVEIVVKNFLAALASTGVGLWLLRSKSSTASTKRKTHLSLALYAFFQAAHALWSFQRLRTKAYGKPWEIHTPWINFKLKLLGRIAEIGIFGWSSYQIMMCWFFRPHLLPPSYEKWITRFANVDMTLIDYLRGVRRGTIIEGQHSDFLAGFCRSVGINPHLGDPYYGVPSCRALHHLDGDKCSQAAVRRFLSTGAAAFMSLYFPLNVLTYILKRRKKSEKKENEPPKTLVNDVKDSILIPSIRSSAFLGMFVASIFGTICLLRRKMGTDRYGVVAGSAICGLSSIVIESPSRRLNLTLYVLPRALTSLYEGKLEKYIPAHFLDSPIMVVSLAILLTCHQIQPRSVQAPTRALLSWIFSKYSL